MSTLMYFIPRSITNAVQDKQELIDVGLAHVDPAMGGRSNYVASGPGQLGGAIWTMKHPDGSDGPDPVYRPDGQTWLPLPSGKAWAGIQNDARPGPETLRRGKVYPGVEIELLDGERWTIPIAHSIDASRLTLPYEVGTREGRFIRKPHRRFAALNASVAKLFAAFIGDTGPLSAAEEIQLAVDALSVNYRISTIEAVDLLGLLDIDAVLAICRAVADLDLIDEAADPLAASGPDAGASSSPSGATAGSGSSVSDSSSTT